jgi:hypothetical protein
MKMKYNLLIVVLFSLLSKTGSSQINEKGKYSLGFGVQAYPAGIMPTFDLSVNHSTKWTSIYRLGLNIVDRQDFSSYNTTEVGSGFGGSYGIRYFFKEEKGIYAGLWTDLWYLDLEWTDSDKGTPEAGNTQIFVVQPWLELGYLWTFSENRQHFGIGAGFGREINIITTGDEVEQGAIGSLKLNWGYRF